MVTDQLKDQMKGKTAKQKPNFKKKKGKDR
jgi:hypothetical protein